MDTFSITAPGNVGSPVICGYNTGQHSETQLGNDSYSCSHDLNIFWLTLLTSFDNFYFFTMPPNPFLSGHGRQRRLPQGYLRLGQHLDPALVGYFGDTVRVRGHHGRAQQLPPVLHRNLRDSGQVLELETQS